MAIRAPQALRASSSLGQRKGEFGGFTGLGIRGFSGFRDFGFRV